MYDRLAARFRIGGGVASMYKFLQSSIRLAYRVTKRALAAIVWLLLDVSELYSKLIAPNMPEEWVAWLIPYAVWLDIATPWVIATIVLAAVFYTYYEVEKQVTRDPKIPKKLREFYVNSDQYSRYDLKNENEFPNWKLNANSWYRETHKWIVENMSEAAASRFNDIPASTMGSMSVKNSDAVNDEHDKLVRAVKRARDSLRDLIENEAWDEKGKRKR